MKSWPAGYTFRQDFDVLSQVTSPFERAALMSPHWLQIVALVSLSTATCCAAGIAIDIVAGAKQHTWIMNIVWPITALWAGPLGLWAYCRFGRTRGRHNVQQAERRGQHHLEKRKPFVQTVALAATHCGAGCTLGDIVAEWIHFAAPLTIAGVAIFGAWLIDLVFAFAFGIGFQYFTIAPIRNLTPAKGVMEAMKADILSLAAWQLGMYGWMAVMRFVILGHQIVATNPAFWFLMQIGAAAGFLTSYPANWWLVKKGIKERM